MQEAAKDLIHVLQRARESGNAPPPPEVVPALDVAYDVQRSLHERSGLPVMVWKLGLTGDEVRRAFGAESPIVGRLPSSEIYADRSSMMFLGAEMYAEAELVFELGKDLPPKRTPYDRKAVAAALKGVYAGIEIARSRFSDSDLPLGLLVADNSMGHALVLGRKLSPGWLDEYSAMEVSLERNGAETVNGSAANVMGNPLDALTWAANWLCENEGGLRREQLVASGACTGATRIYPGDKVVARFGTIGDVQISLTNNQSGGTSK